jgi:hypothetical protein
MALVRQQLRIGVQELNGAKGLSRAPGRLLAMPHATPSAGIAALHTASTSPAGRLQPWVVP